LGTEPDFIIPRPITGDQPVEVGDGFGGPPPTDEVFYARYQGSGTAQATFFVEFWHSVSSGAGTPCIAPQFRGGSGTGSSSCEKTFTTTITSRMINSNPGGIFAGNGPTAFIPFPPGDHYVIGHDAVQSVTLDAAPLTVGTTALEVPWIQAPPNPSGGGIPSYVHKADVFGHMVAVPGASAGQTVVIVFRNDIVLSVPQVGLCATTADGSAIDWSYPWKSTNWGAAKFDSIRWDLPPATGMQLLVYRRTARTGGAHTTTKTYNNPGYGYLPYCLIDGDRLFCAGQKKNGATNVGFVLSLLRTMQTFRFAWFDPSTGAFGNLGPVRVCYNATLLGGAVPGRIGVRALTLID
jgi:hypothetical protein